MNLVTPIAQLATEWIGIVADTIAARSAGRRDRSRITLVEGGDGAFALRGGGDGSVGLAPLRLRAGVEDESLPPDWSQAMRGAAVVLVLSPDSVVTRTLQAPARGVDFLPGIIRAQIDRLTPWTPEEAVFHHGAPRPVGDDRVAVTVAATAREALELLIRPFVTNGAVSVEAMIEMPDGEPITLYLAQSARKGAAGRLRPALAAGFVGAVLAAVLAAILAGFLAPYYAEQSKEAQRRIAKHRAQMGRLESGIGDTPRQLLLSRRQSSPFAVLILEDLSALLPVDTYVTEFRLEGDRLQFRGVTGNASALIRLLEQSPRFSGSGFFAPTTRASGETGERFSLETKVKPRFGSGS